jgi:glycosyltransferase involved in cell wall biosynthesis
MLGRYYSEWGVDLLLRAKIIVVKFDVELKGKIYGLG